MLWFWNFTTTLQDTVGGGLAAPVNLTTAGGLVFQGSATGEFAAYDAATGGKLWSFDTQTGVVAPSTTCAMAVPANSASQTLAHRAKGR